MTLTSEQIESIRRGFDLMSRGLLARTYRPDLLNALCDMALAAAPESALKEAQWVSVPLEPTRKMLDAWHEASLGVYQHHPSTRKGVHWSDSEARMVACYKAMLAARDKPQPHEGG